MKETEILNTIDTVESLIDTAIKKLAVLKKALDGRGTPKSAYRNNAVQNKINEAVARRQRNKVRK